MRSSSWSEVLTLALGAAMFAAGPAHAALTASERSELRARWERAEAAPMSALEVDGLGDTTPGPLEEGASDGKRKKRRKAVHRAASTGNRARKRERQKRRDPARTT